MEHLACVDAVAAVDSLVPDAAILDDLEQHARAIASNLDLALRDLRGALPFCCDDREGRNSDFRRSTWHKRFITRIDADFQLRRQRNLHVGRNGDAICLHCAHEGFTAAART